MREVGYQICTNYNNSYTCMYYTYKVCYHFGSEGNYHSKCSKDEHLSAGHCIVLQGGFPWKK